MDSSKTPCASDKGLRPRGRSAVSRIWVDAVGTANEQSTVLPRQKHKPVWLKPRDSSVATGPPTLKKGESWIYKKHNKAWTNNRELSLQEHLDRNAVYHMPPVPTTPRTLEPYRPLSRKNRRKSSAKIPTAPAAPSVPRESMSVHGIECDDTHVAVHMQKCFLDENSDRIYFRIEDLYRGAFKPKGVLAPISNCLGGNTCSVQEIQSLEPIIGVPVVASSSGAMTPEPIVASSSRAMSPSLQKKSHKKPLFTKNRSKTSEPQQRTRLWNSSPITEIIPVDSVQDPLKTKTPKVKRPKAYTAAKESEVRKQIKARKEELSQLASQDPFDNIQIVLPKSRHEPGKRKEHDRDENQDLQDINDSKMRKDAEEHLTFDDNQIKRNVSMPQVFKDARSDRRGRSEQRPAIAHLDPFDNIQIALPKSGLEPWKQKEHHRQENQDLQDINDSKMRKDAEEHLTFDDNQIKRNVSLPRDFKDARSDRRGRARSEQRPVITHLPRCNTEDVCWSKLSVAKDSIFSGAKNQQDINNILRDVFAKGLAEAKVRFLNLLNKNSSASDVYYDA